MEHGKLVSAAVGVGAWFVAIALSILDAPQWLGWLAFAAGAGFIITAALWWFVGRSSSRPETSQPGDHGQRATGESDASVHERLAVAKRLIATELRAIREDIDLVRSTRPHPHYSHGFALPAARWDEYKELVATVPALYSVVGAAYAAAWGVNQRLEMRRTRAGSRTQTLGVIPDDRLDEAYDAAGRALTSLDENADAMVAEGNEVVRKAMEDRWQAGASILRQSVASLLVELESLETRVLEHRGGLVPTAVVHDVRAFNRRAKDLVDGAPLSAEQKERFRTLDPPHAPSMVGAIIVQLSGSRQAADLAALLDNNREVLSLLVRQPGGNT